MRAKVLFADDESAHELLICSIFRHELSDNIYEFLFKKNGEEALETIKKQEIHVLVTDINMPKMDGLTLLAQVRETYPNIVPVVISAYRDITNIRTAMNSGAFDFLVKPFDRHDIRTTIAKAVQQAKRLLELKTALLEGKAAQQKMVSELRRMDVLKDEFLANVSHELLTPLNGIVGIAESLSDGVGGPISSQVANNLAMIVASGKRLTTLVHDILDLTKIKNNELELDLKNIALRPLLEVVLALSTPLLEEKEVVLQAQLADDLPLVTADENRVQQILHNLVSNAIKFTSKGSVRIEALKEGNYVRITVTDTGIGIPAHQIEHLFGAFENMTEAGIYAGTGLGLMITRRLIHLLKGEVSVNSVLGKGSTFSITLPVAEAYRESGPPSGEFTVFSSDMFGGENNEEELVEMPQPEVRESFRLLAVDDNSVNLRVLKNHFALHNYKVDTAANGDDALRAVEAYPDYDLILLDVMIPGMSGYDVCRKLRETYSLFELPILVLTAKNHPRSYLEGLDAGANDYLARPFDKHELLARAKTLLILKQAVHLALEHNRHLETERLQRGMAENLRRITETLTSTLELDMVLTRFLECLKPVAPYERAVIALRNEDQLEPACLFGFKEAEREKLDGIQKMVDALFRKVSQTQQPLSINNMDELLGLDPSALMSDKVSLLAVPFLSPPDVGGMLLLERDQNHFSPDETRLVAAFAGQAAIAIENARLFEKVQTMAKTEELTGLHNRRHFFVLGREAFECARQTQTPLAAIMLDVDHFKQINDKYGHPVGDEVLKTVAQRIRIACRKTDILGRYGGEEFAVLLPQTTLETTREVAERLRLEIQKEFQLDDCDQTLVITASLGVAERDDQTTTLANLLRHADEALYRAKAGGRNRTVTHEEP